MTTGEASEIIAGLGVRRTFKAEIEPETGVVLLKTRKPVEIKDGSLAGCEVALMGKVFVCWTSRTRLARTLAKAHGLKLRAMNGEAEIVVPAALADKILPSLGAKVRRELSREQQQALRDRLQALRNARSLTPKPQKTGLPAAR